MADKKVDRNTRLSGGPVTRTEIGEASKSLHETGGAAELPQDKGKGALLEKFRAREEQYHRDHPLQANTETDAEETADRPAGAVSESSEEESA
jgi:hypothetical protein